MKTYDIDDIMMLNKSAGRFFFSPNTMRGFKTRVSPQVYQGSGGVYFVTSDLQYDGSRAYTVRTFNPITADVRTMPNAEGVRPFSGLTKYAAHKFAAELAAI